MMNHPQKLVPGEVHPSSHLTAYSLLTGMLFSQKVSAQAKGGPQDVRSTLPGQFYVRGESFLSPEDIY